MHCIPPFVEISSLQNRSFSILMSLSLPSGLKPEGEPRNASAEEGDKAQASSSVYSSVEGPIGRTRQGSSPHGKKKLPGTLSGTKDPRRVPHEKDRQQGEIQKERYREREKKHQVGGGRPTVGSPNVSVRGEVKRKGPPQNTHRVHPEGGGEKGASSSVPLPSYSSPLSIGSSPREKGFSENNFLQASGQVGENSTMTSVSPSYMSSMGSRSFIDEGMVREALQDMGYDDRRILGPRFLRYLDGNRAGLSGEGEGKRSSGMGKPSDVERAKRTSSSLSSTDDGEETLSSTAEETTDKSSMSSSTSTSRISYSTSSSKRDTFTSSIVMKERPLPEGKEVRERDMAEWTILCSNAPVSSRQSSNTQDRYTASQEEEEERERDLRDREKKRNEGVEASEPVAFKREKKGGKGLQGIELDKDYNTSDSFTERERRSELFTPRGSLAKMESKNKMQERASLSPTRFPSNHESSMKKEGREQYSDAEVEKEEEKGWGEASDTQKKRKNLDEVEGGKRERKEKARKVSSTGRGKMRGTSTASPYMSSYRSHRNHTERHRKGRTTRGSRTDFSENIFQQCLQRLANAQALLEEMEEERESGSSSDSHMAVRTPEGWRRRGVETQHIGRHASGSRNLSSKRFTTSSRVPSTHRKREAEMLEEEEEEGEEKIEEHEEEEENIPLGVGGCRGERNSSPEEFLSYRAPDFHRFWRREIRYPSYERHGDGGWERSWIMKGDKRIPHWEKVREFLADKHWARVGRARSQIPPLSSMSSWFPPYHGEYPHDQYGNSSKSSNPWEGSEDLPTVLLSLPHCKSPYELYLPITPYGCRSLSPKVGKSMGKEQESWRESRKQPTTRAHRERRSPRLGERVAQQREVGVRMQVGRSRYFPSSLPSRRQTDRVRLAQFYRERWSREEKRKEKRGRQAVWRTRCTLIGYPTRAR